MKGTMLRTTALTAALLAAAGCATRQELVTWREHSTHFASGDHAVFSLRNDTSSTPRVTRTDLSRARIEAWWGDPVIVNGDQVLAGR
jgi:hypothetical protein